MLWAGTFQSAAEDASDATVTDDGFQHHVGGLLLPDEQYHCTIVTSTHATTTSEPERSISSSLYRIFLMLWL